MVENVFRRLSGISLGIVVLLVQLWVFVNIDAVFPQNSDFWREVILVYLVLQATIFAVPDLRSKLLTVAFLPAFIRIVFVAALTVTLLAGAGSFFVNAEYAKAVAILNKAAVGVIIIHSFYVAVIEELMFRDWLGQKLGMILSSFIFAAFHWVIYAGNYISLAWAFMLGIAFFQIRKRFSPQDNSVNIGAHAGYNLFVLGVFQ